MLGGVWLVTDEVSTAFQLDNFTLRHRLQVCITNGVRNELRVRVQAILKRILLLQLLLGDQVVKIVHLQRHHRGNIRQPSELLLGHLEITIQMQLCFQGSGGIRGHLGNDDIAPVHESDLWRGEYIGEER